MFARIQKTPVRTRALFARVQTNACPESCVVRPDFKKHMSGLCFCLPGFQNTPVRFCFCQPGFQNTRSGHRSGERCPGRPGVPGTALWSGVRLIAPGAFRYLYIGCRINPLKSCSQTRFWAPKRPLFPQNPLQNMWGRGGGEGPPFPVDFTVGGG